MMLGNRGETRATFHETLDFLERRDAPRVHLLVPVRVPGHARLRRRRGGGLARSRGVLLVRLPGAEDALRRLRGGHRPDERLVRRRTAASARATARARASTAAILARLGDYHAAHMDLGGAPSTGRARWTTPSATCGARSSSAIPLPGLAYNYLACIAKARGDVVGMMDALHPRGEGGPAALRARPERAGRARVVRAGRAGQGAARSSSRRGTTSSSSSARCSRRCRGRCPTTSPSGGRPRRCRRRLT